MMDEECRLFRETIEIYRRKAVRVCMELVRYVAMSLTLAADSGDAHLFDEYFNSHPHSLDCSTIPHRSAPAPNASEGVHACGAR